MKNDRVEATQPASSAGYLFLYLIGAATLIPYASLGIEGALSSGAVMTERPGA